MTTIDCDYFLEMEGLDTHFGTNLICQYEFDSSTSILNIEIALEDNKKYYPGFKFTLKSAFMQPWNYHSNFLYHEKFNEKKDI